MKKAKIMLTAITALAIVGGALAFKATNFHLAHLRCYTTGVGVVSTCPVNIYTTANILGAVTTTAPCGKNIAGIATSYYTNADALCSTSFAPTTVTVADQQ